MDKIILGFAFALEVTLGIYQCKESTRAIHNDRHHYPKGRSKIEIRNTGIRYLFIKEDNTIDKDDQEAGHGRDGIVGITGSGYELIRQVYAHQNSDQVNNPAKEKTLQDTGKKVGE